MAAPNVSMRMDRARKERILRAAAVAGKDFSAFVTDAAEKEAERVLNEQAATWLPAVEFDRLMTLLDEPARPLSWAREVKAKKRYRRP
jgi:uncharacterized protein (DUF1778 family)